MSEYNASASKSTKLILTALALGVFGVGVTEFVPVGLLPQIANTFDTSIATTGWVISSYAAGVMVGAPIMTLLSIRRPRKQMLIILMVLFIIGNLLSAVAPNFALLIIGRIVTSFTHGAFFGIGTVVAAELAGPGQRGAAVAYMFSGISLANLIGVPIGTWIGTMANWRTTFLVIAALGILTAVAIAYLVPNLPSPKNVRVGREIKALTHPQVILALLMTLFGFGGVFAALTYLTPIMTDIAGYAESSMSWILIIVGVGMFTGNWTGGKLADRLLMPTVLAMLFLLAATLFAFNFTAHSAILSLITIFFIGFFGMATVAPLQSVVLEYAKGAPTLASSINIGVFNLGNAVAAWLAGATITTSLGLTSAGLVGGLMTSLGLVLAIVAVVLRRKAQETRTTISVVEQQPAA
ncbi:arabinose transporter permease [[Brevibacterium] flavum]|uniref:Arabinose transporter permease n=1 Tax=[Brevibacterium] flavum TaxID=92706 RepID=A0A0F6Z5Z5_9CORY|nr:MULTISPECIES: MFS transporter [Corynebacterium]AKF27072.1 arabinose transporter permease [[Brevibacterium] flavum]KEI22792.1 arabinose transporter permease [Corynebacterium glutamicum ATCC 14067]